MAADLLPDASQVQFTAFDAATRGSLLASTETGTTGATTYSGFLRSAVYLNTLGTLDFYYQVAITSINAGDEVFNLTASNFMGFTVNALVDGTDFDGAGIFTAANNPNLQGPAGSTTTASRNGSGSVVRADFGERPGGAVRPARPTSSAPMRPTTTLVARSRRRTARSPAPELPADRRGAGTGNLGNDAGRLWRHRIVDASPSPRNGQGDALRLINFSFRRTRAVRKRRPFS